MAKDNIALPLSTVKKILSNSGEYRCDPESIKKFHGILIEKCKECAIPFQSRATNDKRKTIQGSKDFSGEVEVSSEED